MDSKLRVRLTLLGLLVGLISTLVGIRLHQIQIVMSERFKLRALDQHRERIEVPAVRGSIFDRHGRELAASMASQSLFARPHLIEDAGDAAARLAPVLGVSERRILDLLKSKKKFVYLKRLLDPAEVTAIGKLGLPLEGYAAFGFESGSKRVYPHGALAVHVIGFANIDGNGIEGIEHEFDEQLQGDPAVYQVWQDGRSGGVRQQIHAPEKRPLDIVLSLDLVLQHIAERELERAVRETGARAASAVLIDPASGQVLALANWPAADLDRYGKARDEARTNRAVVHYYEPGSVFKIVTMAAVLERDRVTDRERFHCENGRYVLPDRTIRDVSAHGWLTPRQIIEKSSNIGMVKVARKLTAEEMRETILRFGFGERSGIELPGEIPGRITSPKDWSGFTHASVAFGHEIGVTVLQMASALATVANDGVRVPPRVVLGARDAEGRFTPQPAPKAHRVLPARTARKLTEMLEGVIERGTGTRAAVEGYRLAGKSGTAQMRDRRGGKEYSGSDYMTSFGGFGPVDAPRIACLVVLDSPRGDENQGGQVAAPVFGRILRDALRYLRIPSDRDTLAAPPAALQAVFEHPAGSSH